MHRDHVDISQAFVQGHLLPGDCYKNSVGWCGWAVSSLLLCCCGGVVCWWPAISLPAQSVIVGEVGQFVGVRWRTVVCVDVLRSGPVAAVVLVYSSVSHL